MGNGSCKNCGIRNSCLKRGVYEYNGIDCNKCWQPTEGRPVLEIKKVRLGEKPKTFPPDIPPKTNLINAEVRLHFQIDGEDCQAYFVPKTTLAEIRTTTIDEFVKKLKCKGVLHYFHEIEEIDRIATAMKEGK